MVRRLVTSLGLAIIISLMVAVPSAVAGGADNVQATTQMARGGSCGFDVNTLDADGAHARMRLAVKYHGGCHPPKMKFRLRARPYWSADDGTVRYGRWREPDYNIIRKGERERLHTYKLGCNSRGVHTVLSSYDNDEDRYVGIGYYRQRERYC